MVFMRPITQIYTIRILHNLSDLVDYYFERSNVSIYLVSKIVFKRTSFCFIEFLVETVSFYRFPNVRKTDTLLRLFFLWPLHLNHTRLSVNK